MKPLSFIFALVLILCCLGSSRAQAPRDSSVVISELLAAPAPIPRSAANYLTTNTQRPPEFFARANVPPDDAPIEDLIQYWTHWTYRVERPVPSDRVRERLLDAGVNDLPTLAFLLPLFPTSEDVAKKIKEAYDRGDGDPKLEESRKAIEKWLLYNSKYFVDELLLLANKVKDDEESGLVDNGEALAALAKYDWLKAEPLLETLVNSPQKRSSTLALTLFYKHSIDEKDAAAELKFRARLQAIASDRSFPGNARYDAIEALSQSEWSGRDEWYLSQFNDESLLQLSDGIHGFASLDTIFARDPDKWIPVMIKLARGKDGTAQQAAAQRLVSYAIKYPRRDVILPVLRWLTEPDWIPRTSDRASFIQTMDRVDVPEGVPGLIWVVENDEDDRTWAARTLARYKDPRAIPALRKALAETSEEDRPLILEGLIASGGITEAEQVAALEAYATRLTTDQGREEDKHYGYYGAKPFPIPVSIGRYLGRLESAPDSLARAVLIRAANLRTRKPDVSQSLTNVAHRWQGRQIDLDLVNRIATNTAEAATVINALNRRDKLRQTVKLELHSLIAAGGAPKGTGAVLLGDDDIAASVLSSSDQLAQSALLAAARLTQTALPVGTVGSLLKSKNSLLALAAERYLLAEDSKEARTLLWQHHPQQAFITGWRENIQLIAGNNFDQIGKREEKLRNELLKPGGPVEIFALLSNTEYYNQVLRIYADKAVYTLYEDSSRYQERVVPKNDVAIFKDFVSTNGLVDFGPQFGPCHYDCWASQFLMLSRDAGRRVFSHQGAGSMMAISQNFLRLGRGEGAAIHYNFEKENKGLEVLYADRNLPALDVWKRGDEIRIFVERPETDEERAERAKDNSVAEDDDARAERWHREYVERRSRFSWRRLKDKDASSITNTPEGYSTFDYTRFPFDEHDFMANRVRRQMQVLSPNSILLARIEKGLWKQEAGTKPVRISEEDGSYANPVVTPDGKWVVLAKSDTNFGEANYVVRLNLETGREFRVALKPSTKLDPVAFLPLHNKVLLRRAHDPDLLTGKLAETDRTEYYLVDPKTGAVQPVSGEFAPLWEDGNRFLQPTGEPDQYWAAIPDEEKNQTQVGRYNLKDFSFKPVLTVPQIYFESMSMWVDEKEEKVYFVYKSQLLRVPLTSTSK